MASGSGRDAENERLVCIRNRSLDACGDDRRLWVEYGSSSRRRTGIQEPVFIFGNRPQRDIRIYSRLDARASPARQRTALRPSKVTEPRETNAAVAA
jgi:hypothetical protein